MIRALPLKTLRRMLFMKIETTFAIKHNIQNPDYGTLEIYLIVDNDVVHTYRMLSGLVVDIEDYTTSKIDLSEFEVRSFKKRD